MLHHRPTTEPRSRQYSTERRLDIDLLRALAVLAVIGLHLRLPAVSGGFLGVDIFFVISGYLISRQIRNRIEAGTFSYIEFLSRRARRLVPALAVTLLLTGGLGIILLSPDSHRSLLQELIYTAAYVSNFLFWGESGYFAAEAINKPLLHTWSLAVEEQFYVFWPALLVLLARRRAARWWPVIGLASLIVCEIVIRRDPAAAFFLFPSRIFEFVVGALASHVPMPEKRPLRTTLDVAAALALMIPLFALTERSHFPGLTVLPSCLGTGWIIASRPSWLNRRHRLASIGSWIGRISYSAYLVHWPLLVFYTQFRGEAIGTADRALMFAVTLGVAHLLWRFVERPFLESNVPVRAFLPAVPLTLALVYGSTLLAPRAYQWVHADRSDLDHLIDELESQQELHDRALRIPQNSNSEGPVIAIAGDSHAIDGGLALHLSAGNTVNIRIVHSICDPLTLLLSEQEAISYYKDHTNPALSPEECRRYHASFLSRLLAPRPDIILFSEDWRPQAVPHLAETISEIRERTDAKIVLLGRNQTFTQMPAQLLRRVTDISQINRTAWMLRVDDSKLNTDLRKVAEATGSTFIDKSLLVCPTRGLCDYVGSGALHYWDRSHWTEAGLQVFGQRFYARMVEEGILVSRP